MQEQCINCLLKGMPWRTLFVRLWCACGLQCTVWRAGWETCLDVDSGRSLRNQIFFFGTALKDCPKGPPTANGQLPPTANHHQPQTSNCHQAPAATDRQLPAANHYQPPPTASYQPPIAANCQLQTANRHQPWLNTRSARGLFGEHCVTEHFFFYSRTALSRLQFVRC